MTDAGSVTVWLGQLRQQNPDAVRVVWERFFDRMVRRARDRLRASNRRVADEEDAALSAFDSFVRAAAAGRFPRLDDRSDLWQVLVMVTERKVADHVRRERAKVRGSGHVRGESGFGVGPDGELAGADAIASGEPPAELVAQLTDDYEHLLAALGDDTLRRIAVLKLEGYESVELAERLGVSLRTIERKLALIRQIWSQVPDAREDGAD